MGIGHPSLKHNEAGWKDSIKLYKEIKEWAENYKKGYIAPTHSN
jgi:hypothetical protein